MIVRKIKADEIKRIEQLSAIAFEFALGKDQTAEEAYEEILQNPKSRLHLHWQSQWAAFEDDDQTMTSCIAAVPYPIHFEGHHCEMIGIGNVATLPPYRNRGGIRACFEAMLPDMYGKGAVFSYLYPFSTAYYRKFGYEICGARMQYRLLLDKLPKTKALGSTHLVEEGNRMLEEIQQIYRMWQEKYNLMVVGEEMEFAWVHKANPARDQQYTYVYIGENGTPKGYMTIEKVDESDGRNLNAKRFFFMDKEGFGGLMSLLVGLAADHRFVSFQLPEHMNLTWVLPEWSMGAGKRELQTIGMARVLHVEKALRMARGIGSGEMILEIQDQQIPQNNGCFEVVFENGKVAGVRRTHQSADVTMGIAAFSRLLIEGSDLQGISWMEGVTVHTSLEKLAPFCCPKDVYLTELF